MPAAAAEAVRAPLGDASHRAEPLERACRRGDLLAALSQESHGDISHVTAAQLLAAERASRGATARAPPTGRPAAPAAATVAKANGGGGAAARDVASRLAKARLVAVVTIDDAAAAEPLARALVGGGMSVVEVVLRTPAAAEALRRICAMRDPSLLVGAGTVLSTEQAAAAVDAGASFIVAPGFNPAVGRWCVERGVPYVPGVATPTEIEAAMALGLTTLKFFPAEASGGAKALKAISAPYSAVRFMPTGGITAANAREYLALKTVLCVGGSWMVPSEAVQKLEFERIESLAAEAMSAVASGYQFEPL